MMHPDLTINASGELCDDVTMLWHLDNEDTDEEDTAKETDRSFAFDESIHYRSY